MRLNDPRFSRPGVNDQAWSAHHRRIQPPSPYGIPATNEWESKDVMAVAVFPLAATGSTGFCADGVCDQAIGQCSNQDGRLAVRRVLPVRE